MPSKLHIYIHGKIVNVCVYTRNQAAFMYMFICLFTHFLITKSNDTDWKKKDLTYLVDQIQ